MGKIENFTDFKKHNESVISIGDKFKVKSIFEVSKEDVEKYIERVKQETGKNPLDNFNMNEIAEQMVLYVLEENFKIETIPYNITVGDETEPEEVEEIEEQPEKEIIEEPEDDIYFFMEEDSGMDYEEIDIDDLENEEPKMTAGDFKKKEGLVEESMEVEVIDVDEFFK